MKLYINILRTYKKIKLQFIATSYSVGAGLQSFLKSQIKLVFKWLWASVFLLLVFFVRLTKWLLPTGEGEHESFLKIRPLSPALLAYKTQWNTLVSVGHRVSGIFLVIFASSEVISCATSPFPIYWERVLWYFGERGAALNVVLCFFLFHLVTGVRHFWVDQALVSGGFSSTDRFVRLSGALFVSAFAVVSMLLQNQSLVLGDISLQMPPIYLDWWSSSFAGGPAFWQVQYATEGIWSLLPAAPGPNWSSRSALWHIGSNGAGGGFYWAHPGVLFWGSLLAVPYFLSIIFLAWKVWGNIVSSNNSFLSLVKKRARYFHSYLWSFARGGACGQEDCSCVEKCAYRSRRVPFRAGPIKYVWAWVKRVYFHFRKSLKLHRGKGVVRTFNERNIKEMTARKRRTWQGKLLWRSKVWGWLKGTPKGQREENLLYHYLAEKLRRLFNVRSFYRYHRRRVKRFLRWLWFRWARRTERVPRYYSAAYLQKSYWTWWSVENYVFALAAIASFCCVLTGWYFWEGYTKLFLISLWQSVSYLPWLLSCSGSWGCWKVSTLGVIAMVSVYFFCSRLGFASHTLEKPWLFFRKAKDLAKVEGMSSLALYSLKEREEALKEAALKIGEKGRAIEGKKRRRFKLKLWSIKELIETAALKWPRKALYEGFKASVGEPFTFSAQKWAILAGIIGVFVGLSVLGGSFLGYFSMWFFGLVCVIFHGYLGIRSILLDYIKPKYSIQGILEKLELFYCFIALYIFGMVWFEGAALIIARAKMGGSVLLIKSYVM